MLDYEVRSLLSSLREHISQVRESNLVLRETLYSTQDVIDTSKKMILQSDLLIGRIAQFFSGAAR
jgi:hypothetical protein